MASHDSGIPDTGPENDAEIDSSDIEHMNSFNLVSREGAQSVIKAVELLVLAAAYSPISQLTLSPVYGSIPSSNNHQRILMAAFLLAWTAKTTMLTYFPRNSAAFLPVLAFAIPTFQFYLFRYSRRLGLEYGPMITESLTCFPLVVLSVFSAGTLLDSINLGQYGERVKSAGPAIASYAIFSVAQKASAYLIKQQIGSSFVFTRCGLQFVIATFYALLFPSKLLVLAALPLLHSASLNVHVPLEETTTVLNATLHALNYSLVARQESVTGYISVLDNLQDGFRVMRCDHSLLGGEWLQEGKSILPSLKEPIYSVFVMLEAVRLVESEASERHPVATDDEKKALVVGLGVGTAPSALIAHGVHTTTVEIDPVVHDFATKYFNLPSNHTSIIGDATVFVERVRKAPGHDTYDYIIHDVFTGGAEPVELFTEEFLLGLSDLLSKDGVIAINYAGDLLLPSARLVVHTVKSVFPSCRLFRDDAASLEADATTNDFTNMVMFCRKSTGIFTFRDPVEADCLGSQARRYFLLPQHEIQVDYFEGRDGEVTTLKRGQTQVLEAYEAKSAARHWEIMRTVLPDVIWEAW